MIKWTSQPNLLIDKIRRVLWASVLLSWNCKQSICFAQKETVKFARKEWNEVFLLFLFSVFFLPLWIDLSFFLYFSRYKSILLRFSPSPVNFSFFLESIAYGFKYSTTQNKSTMKSEKKNHSVQVKGKRYYGLRICRSLLRCRRNSQHSFFTVFSWYFYDTLYVRKHNLN